ncbi:MAG: hypothetical protein ABIN36_17175 [Ferruginibacter sp.]
MATGITLSPPVFFTRSFNTMDCEYRVLLCKELNPITGKPTGGCVGTFISKRRGTKNFKFHKDRVEMVSNLDVMCPGVTVKLCRIIKDLYAFDEVRINEEGGAKKNIEFPGSFIVRAFRYNDTIFNVAITAELVEGLGGLVPTGIYLITLVNESEGTRQFEMIPGADGKWEPGVNVRGMHSDLINELVTIINKLKANKTSVPKCAALPIPKEC